MEPPAMEKPAPRMPLDGVLASMDEPEDAPVDAARHAELLGILEDVRRMFFPGTPLEGWTLRVGLRWSGAALAGTCDPGTRTLWVARAVVDGDPDLLRATLIHEVAHVGSGLSHGQRFKTRLRALVKRAHERGEVGVAQALERDLAALGVREISAPESYAWVTAYVQARGERADFNEMLLWICTERAHAPTELLARYPRLHRVFEEERARGPMLQDAMERARRFCTWRDAQVPRDD